MDKFIEFGIVRYQAHTHSIWLRYEEGGAHPLGYLLNLCNDVLVYQVFHHDVSLWLISKRHSTCDHLCDCANSLLHDNLELFF